MLNKSFKANSLPVLFMNNPASYKILERAYKRNYKSDETGLIDRYFIRTKSSKALYDRLEAVISYGVKKIPELSHSKQGECLKIVNYGCGAARDTIGIMSRLKEINTEVDCIDVDSEAIRKATKLCKKNNLKNFNFLKKSMTKVEYRKEVDFGLMIGVLCGLTFDQCVSLLKRIKPHFAKDGVLVASCVLKTMRRNDFATTYLFNNVFCWNLIYKTPKQVKDIFEAAGYEWKGCFYDEPLKYHIMGIGTPAPNDIKNF